MVYRTKRYTTASGSIYDVRTYRSAISGAVVNTEVRRIKLGEKHDDGDLERLARRKADNLGEFREVGEFKCVGVGFIALIVFDGEEKAIRTNKVVSIEDIYP